MKRLSVLEVEEYQIATWLGEGDIELGIHRALIFARNHVYNYPTPDGLHYPVENFDPQKDYLLPPSVSCPTCYDNRLVVVGQDTFANVWFLDGCPSCNPNDHSPISPPPAIIGQGFPDPLASEKARFQVAIGTSGYRFSPGYSPQEAQP